MTRKIFGTALLIGALVGCGDLKAVALFARDVNREFQMPVNVNITNGSHLRITFRNVPDRLNDSTARSDFAYRVAQYAKSRYPKADSLKDVTIAFADVKSVGPVSVTRTEAPFVFKLRDIR